MRQYLVIVEVHAQPRLVTSQVITVPDSVGPNQLENTLAAQSPEHHVVYVYDLAAVR